MAQKKRTQKKQAPKRKAPARFDQKMDRGQDLKRDRQPEDSLPQSVLKKIQQFQKNEITEYHIYTKLAQLQKSPDNEKILREIGDDEKKHYDFWKTFTGKDIRPNRWKISYYYTLARVAGLTFAIKLMEQGEDTARDHYNAISDYVPQAEEVAREEDNHENKLINMLQEERLEYAGSVVLGLNDALVELTGALAGLTFAMQDARLVALAGLITGVSASLSMGASEYLSTRSEGEQSRALKASFYTGGAYIVTVILLVLPYLLLDNPYISLGFTLLGALGVIFVFNFYISVAKDYSFKRRFLEMAGLSMGVAALSFGIGYLIRTGLGIEV